MSNPSEQSPARQSAVGQSPVEQYLAGVLSRSWWLLLLRGIAAIVFAIFAWLQPEITVAVLVLLFGAYSMADGILGIWTAISGRKDNAYWWVLLLWGLVGIGIGVLTVIAPAAVTLALLIYVAVWAIATGVLQIIAAVRLRKEIEGEWLLGLAGVLSVVFGILLVAQPGLGILTLLWLLAGYTLVFGIVLIVLAFKARSFGHKSGSHA
ncbi:HdeD family acid-resistance protein [Corticibacter populi]|uniref:HdeD family acid-resistance protein n=1 Tax=Corticibacter populi TaxID=1550736 RepID=A0A3M6QRJ0_9BURK|nr:HdeD family acid-resistance protein [Corticibacter populi]RMX05032.1 HdeD family acid-resistance protein [Corticibacter populi]RZS33532.1 uncharacterized membrane protein HdeD (DUF308 family) [Corticibacter populi]